MPVYFRRNIQRVLYRAPDERFQVVLESGFVVFDGYDPWRNLQRMERMLTKICVLLLLFMQKYAKLCNVVAN